MKTRIILSMFVLIIVSAAAAFGQQERTFYLVCEAHASTMYSDFDRDTITVSTLRPEQIEFTASGNKYSATKVDGYNFLSGGKGGFRLITPAS